jgi:hypothetical protein
VAQHHRQHLRLVVLDLDLLQDGDHKHGGLAHARLGLTQDVVAHDRLGDALVLHCNCDACVGEGGGGHALEVRMRRSLPELRATRNAGGRLVLLRADPLRLRLRSEAPSALHPSNSPSLGCSKPQCSMALTSSGCGREGQRAG